MELPKSCLVVVFLKDRVAEDGDLFPGPVGGFLIGVVATRRIGLGPKVGIKLGTQREGDLRGVSLAPWGSGSPFLSSVGSSSSIPKGMRSDSGHKEVCCG